MMNQRGLGAARNDVPQAGGRYDIGDNVEGDDARTLCTGDEQISSNCEHVAARMTQCTATRTDQRALLHTVEEIVRGGVVRSAWQAAMRAASVVRCPANPALFRRVRSAAFILHPK